MNGTMKLLGWVGGIVVILITIYTTFHVPLSQAIQDEVKTRGEEDAEIRKDLVDACNKQHDQNADIKVMLAEIRADLKYLKKNGI